MAAPQLSDDLVQQAATLFLETGNKAEAARRLGIPDTTLKSRLNVAATRGLLGFKPVLPGFRISQTAADIDEQGNVRRQFVQQKPEHGEEFAVPTGHVVKGVSALVDPDGREIVKWVKTREGIDHTAVIDIVKEAFKDYEGRAPAVPRPLDASTSLLTLIPCNDWHINLLTWEREVGENWDLKIAEDVIGRTVDDVIARSPASGTAIILGGGDLMHADNNQNRTAKSGNELQADGRHQKGLEVACRLKVRAIDRALLHNGNVIVRILPGNHDENSAVAVAYFLSAWYRNEPRVTVDIDPSLFFWHRFGKVLLGATHGHTVKAAQMPGIMAHRRAEDWGATKFRYVHTFHLHHAAKTATEGNGVISEIHQAPIPQDAWHFGAGFLSGRSIQSITYHADKGEVARVRAAIA